ncbi:hypothetical protein IV417_09635 [Alphaproteobacteria bacterium KMM 3653]|uniref:Translocase n=1 Tax=Harenicola maris TaxID=2841044 RepID=A0AAP2CNE5_9RHOB|nr:hypothetical protein [Harenicola maris]
MNKNVRRYAMAGSVFSLALATGFVMQNGDKIASLVVGADDEAVVVGSAPIELGDEPKPAVAAAIPLPESTPMAEVPTVEGAEVIQLAAAEGLTLPSDPMSDALPQVAPGDMAAAVSVDAMPSPAEAVEGQTRFSEYGLPCSVEITAAEGIGGLVDLSLTAPCYANSPVTITHEALRFTQATNEAGVMQVSVPALAETAKFELGFDTGSVATTETKVSVFRLMSHAAVQWQGDNGMQIHAFEYGSDYGQEGHISGAAPQSAHRADRLAGGFLTRLGEPGIPGAWMAEVYSFPTGGMSDNGVVRINIEAEVSSTNCGREMRAETIQPNASGSYSMVDLTLAMPNCDAAGEFLVLKNILRDIKIAAN